MSDSQKIGNTSGGMNAETAGGTGGENLRPQSTRTQFKGVFLLLLTAFIWGTSFVAQSVGMESIQAFTFAGIRTLMGAAALLPVVLFRDRRAVSKMNAEERAEKKKLDRQAFKSGALLGVVFCAAGNFQQFAFYYSTAGKIAFITALYMFFVPLLGLFLRKRVPFLTWICVVCGFIGLYFLCFTPGEPFVINRGDFLSLICSVLFAVHILLIERFARDVDGIKMSCVQFAVGGTLSCILMFIFETPVPGDIMIALPALLYSGVFSCGIAYTLQILGQRYTEATIATLLMSMESVFAVLSAAVLLHERLTGWEILGCTIMFAAIILSQLSETITARWQSRHGPDALPNA